jgi:hypothetical protein
MAYRVRILITALLLLSLPAGAAAAAGGVTIPTAYTPEELTAVREWEKTWVGKKIDHTNIDQVAMFMPESYVGIYKDPEKWGGPPEGLYFTIVPYREVTPTKGMIEATHTYAPLVRTHPDGTIENYAEIAGIPYPQPKTGLEMAWNFELNNHGDTCQYRKWSPNINPARRNERLADQEYTEMYFIHRTEIDPKPAFSPNRRGAHRAYFMHTYLPSEFLNMRMYTMRFIDQDKEDELYIWYSQFRRIRRMSTAQKMDNIDGTDLIYDDEYFWEGRVMLNTYTYIGRKDLLCTRRQDMRATVRQLGQGIVNGLTYERCNTFVVEALHKDPHYVYGKRIWYLDPESYLILWTEIYDQRGNFWKCFLQHTDMLTTEIGETKHAIVGSTYVDFQRTHAGLSDSQKISRPVISIDVSPDIFTVRNLQKTY